MIERSRIRCGSVLITLNKYFKMIKYSKELDITMVGWILYYLGAVRGFPDYDPRIRLLHPAGVLVIIAAIIFSVVTSPFVDSSIRSTYSEITEDLSCWW